MFAKCLLDARRQDMHGGVCDDSHRYDSFFRLHLFLFVFWLAVDQSIGGWVFASVGAWNEGGWRCKCVREEIASGFLGGVSLAGMVYPHGIWRMHDACQYFLRVSRVGTGIIDLIKTDFATLA